MAQVLAPKDQWFVVHVLSGQENKVRDNIEKRVKTEEMGDVIYEVLVPTERVSEIKRGKKIYTIGEGFDLLKGKTFLILKCRVSIHINIYG